MNGILDIDQVITNQIIAAKIAENALRDIEDDTQTRLTDLQTVFDETQVLNERFAQVVKERDDFKSKIETI